MSSTNLLDELIESIPQNTSNYRKEHNLTTFSPSDRPELFITPVIRSKYNEPYKPESQAILISARGAIGKSVLAQHLSNRANQPLWRLEQDEAVGAASLIRHLSRYTNTVEPYNHANKLPQAIIIDSFDEARTRVSSTSWNEFTTTLIDALKIGIKLVLLGRDRTLEELWIQLEENEIKTSWLEVSHFDSENQTKYVDCKVKGDKTAVYISARDAIISSLKKSILKKSVEDISQEEQEEQEKLVGYAPVLDAIATLLNEDCNYAALESEFAKDNSRNIEELKKVLIRILKREQSKIGELLAKDLNIKPSLAYSPKEQIEWLFHSLYDTPEPSLSYIAPEKQTQYREGVQEFVLQHPFRNEHTWASSVFGAYAASTTMTGELEVPTIGIKRRDIEDIGGKSGLLLDFTNSANRNIEIDEEQLIALHQSLLASSQPNSSLIIEDNDHSDTCNVQFLGSREYEQDISEYTLIPQDDKCISFAAPIEHLTVSSEKTVHFFPTNPDNTLTIGPDVYIRALNVLIEGDALDFSRRAKAKTRGMTLTDYSDSVVFELSEPFQSNIQLRTKPATPDNFEIRCPSFTSLQYPWHDYGVAVEESDSGIDWNSRAIRFLNMLMTLTRNHGHKGARACYIPKLQGRQSIKRTDFSSVISFLENEGILYASKRMIFIEPKAEQYRFSGKKVPGQRSFEDVKEFWQPIADEISNIIQSER